MKGKRDRVSTKPSRSRPKLPHCERLSVAVWRRSWHVGSYRVLIGRRRRDNILCKPSAAGENCIELLPVLKIGSGLGACQHKCFASVYQNHTTQPVPQRILCYVCLIL